MKISAKDVSQWLAMHKLKKQPADLNSSELDQVAKDLKVDKKQLVQLIASSHFDAVAIAPPVTQNKLHGEIAGGAVTHNPGRGIYDSEK